MSDILNDGDVPVLEFGVVDDITSPENKKDRGFAAPIFTIDESPYIPDDVPTGNYEGGYVDRQAEIIAKSNLKEVVEGLRRGEYIDLKCDIQEIPVADERLYIISTIFNPKGYESRYRLYHEFVKRLRFIRTLF